MSIDRIPHPIFVINALCYCQTDIFSALKSVEISAIFQDLSLSIYFNVSQKTQAKKKA